MCGICGVLTGSTLAKTEASLFRDLLFLNSLRGQDSTGVASIQIDHSKKSKTFRFNYAKDTVSSDIFLRFPSDNENVEEGKKLVFGPSKRGLIGHCRAATVGKVTRANAHPFFIPGSLMGVHNGTISKVFEGRNNFETDSEACFNLIDQYEIPHVIEEIDGYSSAFVFVWYDIAQHTLNILRNNDRPLTVGTVWNGSTLAFSSTYDMLRMAVLNNKLVLEEGSFTPKPYHHYIWDLSNPKIKNPEINDYSSSAFKKHYPATTTVHTTTRSQLEKEWDKHTSGGSVSQVTTATTKPASGILPKGKWSTEKKRVVFDWENQEGPLIEGAKPIQTEGTVEKTEENQRLSSRTFRVYRGGNGFDYVTPEKFEEILMEGCAVCSMQEDINDPDVEYNLHWIEKNMWICEDCASNPSPNLDWVTSSVKTRLKKPLVCC